MNWDIPFNSDIPQERAIISLMKSKMGAMKMIMISGGYHHNCNIMQMSLHLIAF